MSLKPGEDIGLEIHEDNDQFFRFDAGQGTVVINKTSYAVKDGDAVVVPAGAQHNIINSSDTEDLKLYTIYTPPHHQDGIDHETKQFADSNETDFEGVTTE
jgi:mannose-6-phosphate isomerase-like protein (cupin superfamily)